MGLRLHTLGSVKERTSLFSPTQHYVQTIFNREQITVASKLPFLQWLPFEKIQVIIRVFFFTFSQQIKFNGPQASNARMQNVIYYYNQAFGFASGSAMAYSSKMLSLNVLRLNNYVAKCNLG